MTKCSLLLIGSAGAAYYFMIYKPQQAALAQAAQNAIVAAANSNPLSPVSTTIPAPLPTAATPAIQSSVSAAASNPVVSSTIQASPGVSTAASGLPVGAVE